MTWTRWGLVVAGVLVVGAFAVRPLLGSLETAARLRRMRREDAAAAARWRGRAKEGS